MLPARPFVRVSDSRLGRQRVRRPTYETSEDGLSKLLSRMDILRIGSSLLSFSFLSPFFSSPGVCDYASLVFRAALR